jgi:DNA gyrase inhibitor GyrI
LRPSAVKGLVAHPGGRGVAAPLRYLLAPHQLEHSAATTGKYCSYESETAAADPRPTLTGAQNGWQPNVAEHKQRKPQLRLRMLSMIEQALHSAINHTPSPPQQ